MTLTGSPPGEQIKLRESGQVAEVVHPLYPDYPYKETGGAAVYTWVPYRWWVGGDGGSWHYHGYMNLPRLSEPNSKFIRVEGPYLRPIRHYCAECECRYVDTDPASYLCEGCYG